MCGLTVTIPFLEAPALPRPVPEAAVTAAAAATGGGTAPGPAPVSVTPGLNILPPLVEGEGFAGGLNIVTVSDSPGRRAYAVSPTTQAKVSATSSGLLAARRPEPLPGATVGPILPRYGTALNAEFDLRVKKKGGISIKKPGAPQFRDMIA